MGSVAARALSLERFKVPPACVLMPMRSLLQFFWVLSSAM